MKIRQKRSNATPFTDAFQQAISDKGMLCSSQLANTWDEKQSLEGIVFKKELGSIKQRINYTLGSKVSLRDPEVRSSQEKAKTVITKTAIAGPLSICRECFSCHG